MTAKRYGSMSGDLSGSSAGQASGHNRGLVIRAIRMGSPISRAEISRRTGLTKPTIATIVDKLLDEGLVLEARRRHGLRGQPAIELEINPDGCFSIGIDIDRDHMTVLAIDAVGAVRGRVHHEKAHILPDEFVRLTAEALSHFQRGRLIDEARLAGIGLAIPGWIGEIQFPGKPEGYECWADFDVRSALAELTGKPLYIDNESNAATMAEYEYGFGAESNTFFYIYVSACTGGGLILDGRCHQGVMGLGGEISWTMVGEGDGLSDGDPVPLGHVFSLLLLLEFLQQHGYDVTCAADLTNTDDRGRALITQWLKRASIHLAEAVRHVALIVDPDAVILGGRLPLRLADELIQLVHEQLAHHDHHLPTIHRAAVPHAAALGAAAMPLSGVFASPMADPRQQTRVPLSHLERARAA